MKKLAINVEIPKMLHSAARRFSSIKRPPFKIPIDFFKHENFNANQLKMNLSKTVQHASVILNQLTGYGQIEAMKKRVETAETAYAQHRSDWQKIKHDYEQVRTERVQLQRDMNGLLQRKHQWTPEDVLQFTNLFGKEHQLDREESDMKQTLLKAESKVEKTLNQLMDSIRERYREEQLWSDKIRSISGYGTFGLMALNVLLFLLFHGYFEPRRRHKMIHEIQTALEPNVNTDVIPWNETLTDIHQDHQDLQALMQSLHEENQQKMKAVEQLLLTRLSETPSLESAGPTWTVRDAWKYISFPQFLMSKPLFVNNPWLDFGTFVTAGGAIGGLVATLLLK